MWFTSREVTYFFVFVVTLVVGAMVMLLYAERRARKNHGVEKGPQRPVKAKTKRKPKRRRRR